MSSGSYSELPQVQQVLQRCRRQILQHTFLVGIATVLIAVVGYLLTVSCLDYLLGLPGIVRAVVLLLFVAGAGIVIWRYLVVPLRLTTPARQLGAAIDLTCPQLQESLATLISIQSPEASRSETGSSAMQQRIQQQVSDQLKSLGAQQFVNSAAMKKRCGLAAVVLFAAIIPLVLWPSASALSMQRFVQPFANLATVSNLYFDVENGNRTVARWSNVLIAATPRWREGDVSELPQDVRLKLVAENGTSETIPMSFDEVEGCFVYRLSRIASPVQYQIVGGGTTSEMFQIVVVDAPSVEVAVMTVIPPAYTGQAVQRFDGMGESMTVFEGSDLQIHLEFNKPVKSADLVWTRRDERPLTEAELFDIEFDNLTGEEVPMMDLEAPALPEPDPLVMRSSGELSEDGMSASLNLKADVGGDFEFVLMDAFELNNPTEPERSMSVVFDEAPRVKVNGIQNEDQYRATDILPINCFVTDDVGIGTVEMQYSVNATPIVTVPVVGFDAGDKEVTEKFRLALEDLKVKDGDWLTIRIRATDERPDPGPHEVWSEDIAIEISKDAKPPGARALEQQTQEMIEALKQLGRQLEKDKLRAEELQLSARREWSDSDQEQVRRLSEKEQQQGRILEQLASEVATHPMMKAESAALQQLAPELRERLPEMLESAADETRTAAAKSLQVAEDQIETVRQELQRQIGEIEKRARLEQDLAELNRLALDAGKLAQDANALETDKQNPQNKPEQTSREDWQDQLDQRQVDLTQERLDLTEDIESLLDEERELLEAAQRAQTERYDKLKQAAGELAGKQNQIAKALDQPTGDPAAQAASQQHAQQDVASQAAKLPDDLSELVERMELEALQMQQQAQQAAAAESLAEQAQKNAEQAADQLQRGENQQAQESGQQAANQLDQIANTEDATNKPAEDSNALVPNEVGESVAEALQKLQQAAKAMQQQTDQQPSSDSGESAEQGNNAEQGEPGEGQQSDSQDGQPGEGSSSSEGQQQGKPGQQGQPSASQEQLDSAAKSLAQAAKDALPGQFDPGQPPDGKESEQAGRDAMGNPAMWDGRIPDDLRKELAGSRDWGKVADELDTETSSSAQVSRDNEYRSLIRRYFRELAKATADQ